MLSKLVFLFSALLLQQSFATTIWSAHSELHPAKGFEKIRIPVLLNEFLPGAAYELDYNIGVMGIIDRALLSVRLRVERKEGDLSIVKFTYGSHAAGLKSNDPLCQGDANVTTKDEEDEVNAYRAALDNKSQEFSGNFDHGASCATKKHLDLSKKIEIVIERVKGTHKWVASIDTGKATKYLGSLWVHSGRGLQGFVRAKLYNSHDLTCEELPYITLVAYPPNFGDFGGSRFDLPRDSKACPGTVYEQLEDGAYKIYKGNKK